MYVYTIDINGTVKVANIKVVLSSKIDHSAYELVEHNVSSNPNLFKIDLSTMYSNLGNDLNTWKINVKLANTEYKLYSKYENGALSGEINVNAAAFIEYVVKKLRLAIQAMCRISTMLSLYRLRWTMPMLRIQVVMEIHMVCLWVLLTT